MNEEIRGAADERRQTYYYTCDPYRYAAIISFSLLFAFGVVGFNPIDIFREYPFHNRNDFWILWTLSGLGKWKWLIFEIATIYDIPYIHIIRWLYRVATSTNISTKLRKFTCYPSNPF